MNSRRILHSSDASVFQFFEADHDNLKTTRRNKNTKEQEQKFCLEVHQSSLMGVSQHSIPLKQFHWLQSVNQSNPLIGLAAICTQPSGSNKSASLIQSHLLMGSSELLVVPDWISSVIPEHPLTHLLLMFPTQQSPTPSDLPRAGHPFGFLLIQLPRCLMVFFWVECFCQ